MKRTGRPPLNDEAATTRIRVRVTPGQRLELVRVAEENDTDISGVIREAVNTYVADYREGTRVFRRTKRDERPQNVDMGNVDPMSTQNTPTGQPSKPTTTQPAPNQPSSPGTATPSSTPSTPSAPNHGGDRSGDR